MKFNDVVCFPSIPWDHSWERQQELMYRLASHYDQKDVTIVHPLGLINHNPFDISNISKKLIDRYSVDSNSMDFYENKKLANMSFVKPFFIPVHFNSLFNYINFKFLTSEVNVSDNTLSWATYINGFTFEFFYKSKYRVLDFATRRQANEELSQAAKDLEISAVKIADLIFVDNYNTYLDYEKYNSNIYYVPQGVNLEDFASSELAEEYSYLKEDNKKIIGYCGNLHKYIDFDMLENVIAKLPQYIFIFVGKIIDEKANKLKQYNNVIFTGFKPHSELHKYYNLFDVGLIPYTLEPFTTGVYPTKFLEYVACGTPVISSRLPDLERYDYDFIQIYDDELSFISYIDMFIGTQLDKGIMKEFSNKNTWDCRFDIINSKIKELVS